MVIKPPRTYSWTIMNFGVFSYGTLSAMLSNATCKALPRAKRKFNSRCAAESEALWRLQRFTWFFFEIQQDSVNSQNKWTNRHPADSQLLSQQKKAILASSEILSWIHSHGEKTCFPFLIVCKATFCPHFCKLCGRHRGVRPSLRMFQVDRSHLWNFFVLWRYSEALCSSLHGCHEIYVNVWFVTERWSCFGWTTMKGKPHARQVQNCLHFIYTVGAVRFRHWWSLSTRFPL